jgi:hypothetical protein
VICAGEARVARRARARPRLRRRVRQAAEDGVDLGVIDVVDLD